MHGGEVRQEQEELPTQKIRFFRVASEKVRACVREGAAQGANRCSKVGVLCEGARARQRVQRVRVRVRVRAEGARVCQGRVK